MRIAKPAVLFFVAFLLSVSQKIPVFAGESTGKRNKPNIVFIMADDLGWGDLGCYGHPYIRTPNLDGLAKRGTLFTSFYVNGPTCSPSRAGFMTGQFPARLGIRGGLQGDAATSVSMGMVSYLDPKTPTITRLLREASCRIGHFGKWHLGHTPDAPPPTAYGIDDARCLVANPSTLHTKDRAHNSEAIIDESLRFIEENKGRLFYVNIWLIDPHATVDPSKDQMVPYAQFHPKGVSDHGTMQTYFAVVSEVDKQVGRLLGKLDELGLAENTIVVFSSDNGPEHIGQPDGQSSNSGVGSAGPFRGHKHVLYEGGIRTPFIVRWPGHTPAGKVDDATILSGVDWLPTLCALAGSKLPKGVVLDGEDMSQAFLGKPQERMKPLMWEAQYQGAWVHLNLSPQLAIREGKWKLLMNPDGGRIELHDLSIDAGEVDNLSDNNPRVVARLSGKLLAWQKNRPFLPVAPDVRCVEQSPPPYPWPQEGEN